MKTILNMKLAKIFTLAGLLAVSFSSCKKDDDYVEVTGDAKIRLVNTVQGSSPQDVYQNDTKLSTGLAYGQNTDYLTIVGGTGTSITLKNTGTQTVTATTLAAAQVGASYTAFYYTNGSGGATITGFADDTTLPAAGKVRIRFVNLGTTFINNINVNLTNGTLVAGGLAAGYVSVYNVVDANTALNVTVVGSTDVKVIPATEFQSGKIYTVWFDAASNTMANYHVIAQN